MKDKPKHRCEVMSGFENICDNVGVTLIEDAVCNKNIFNKKYAFFNNPFWVCHKHKKEFLKGDHYKEVKVIVNEKE